MKKEKLTIGKLKKFLADNPDLADDVGVYYPHYYKGYGLAPVGEIEKGQVPSRYGGKKDMDVVVLDWRTMLHTDSCLIEDTRDTAKKLDELAKKRGYGDKDEVSEM